MNNYVENIPITMHPKAFAAFGADLVTNDVVALIELVKNSYDAFAYNVEIEFSSKEENNQILSITDDGLGMTVSVIKNAWAVIATNNKIKNPYIERNNQKRAVSGNKGMGRFSAARLGGHLCLLTKTKEEGCFRINLDWDMLNSATSAEECSFVLEKVSDDSILTESGTVLTISRLNHIWNSEDFADLQEELSRIINPFKNNEKFNISLKCGKEGTPIDIQVPEFVNHPKYLFSAEVDENGTSKWSYCFSPLKKGVDFSNNQCGDLTWSEVLDDLQNDINKKAQKDYKALKDKLPSCGKFSLEIRVWDRDSESIQDITELFSMKRATYKNALRAYKGLSVYRDGVLVLPKSESSRDWIGLDLRRVSRVGDRISTNQIIGIINISSSNNPNIKDATDREKLVDTIEYLEFVTIINALVKLLEGLRKADRIENEKHSTEGSRTLTDLLSDVDSNELLSEVEERVKTGCTIEDLVQIVKDYNSDTKEKIDELKDRLVYYGQVASVGSISGFIIHEIRGRMTSVKRYLDYSSEAYSPFPAKIQRSYDHAVLAHQRMIEVSNTFAPIFDAGLRQRKNFCNLSQEINNSIALLEKRVVDNNVRIIVECEENAVVTMHRGELQTVLINIIDNAIYWTSQKNPIENRLIEITVSQRDNKHLNVEISDNGPGVEEKDVGRIFSPGVTKKKFGVGMGLVIVAEILSKYDADVSVMIPGRIDNGATFNLLFPGRGE